MSIPLGLMDSAPRLVEALLNSIWQGTLLALVIRLLLRRLCGRFDAATKYNVWLATLLAIVCLPLLNALVSSRLQSAQPLAAPSNQRAIRIPEQPALASMQGPESRAAEAQSLARGPLNAGASYTAKDAQPSLVGASQASETAGLRAGDSLASHARMRDEDSRESPMTRSSFSIRLSGERWPRLFLLCWLLGVSVMMLRLTRSYLSLGRLMRTSRALNDELQSRLGRWLKACGTRRRVVLLRGSAEVPAPLMMGLRRAVILFPEELADRLTREEFDQILLHELAHARRFDDWTNLLQKLLEALFFFHPAILFIGRQLNAEREIACDQWAVSVTGERRSYASCLAKLFELTRTTRSAMLAPGAMKVKSHLSTRIETILQGQRATTARRSSFVRLLVPLCLLCAMLIQFGRVPPVIALGVRDDGAMKSAQAHGPIAGASADVPAQVQESGIDSWLGELSRAIVLDEKSGVGQLDDAGREAAPQASREGYASESFSPKAAEGETAQGEARRAQAGDGLSTATTLRPDGGPTGNPPLENPDGIVQGEADNRRAGQDAGRPAPPSSSSSGAPEPPAELFRMVEASGSAATQREILTTLLRRDGLSTEILVQTFKVARQMDSDGEKAELLVNVAGACTSEPAVLDAFFSAAASIGSAGEKRRALAAILKMKGRDRGVLLRVLKTASSIDSDGEIAELLVKAASLYAIDKGIASAYFSAVSAIDSAGERRRVLTAMLRRGDLGEEVLIQLVRFARNISSDGEKAEFLVAVAQACPGDDAMLSAYMATAASINSTEEQRRALSAILKRKGLSRKDQSPDTSLARNVGAAQ